MYFYVFVIEYTFCNRLFHSIHPLKSLIMTYWFWGEAIRTYENPMISFVVIAPHKMKVNLWQMKNMSNPTINDVIIIFLKDDLKEKPIAIGLFKDNLVFNILSRYAIDWFYVLWVLCAQGWQTPPNSRASRSFMRDARVCYVLFDRN